MDDLYRQSLRKRYNLPRSIELKQPEAKFRLQRKSTVSANDLPLLFVKRSNEIVWVPKSDSEGRKIITERRKRYSDQVTIN